MAETTDPLVVNWANTRVRPIADALRHVDDLIVSYKADYAAQGINAALVAAGASQLIADGSATDGRVRITGTTIQNLKACIDQVQTAMDTTLVSGVGSPPMTTINQAQVNGSVKS